MSCGSIGQVSDVVSVAVQAFIKTCVTLDNEQLQLLVGNKKCLSDAISNAVTSLVMGGNGFFKADLSEWERFYGDVIEIDLDVSNLIIPPKPVGKRWLIVVAPNITHEQIISGLKRWFGVLGHSDLDSIIDMTKEQRTTTDTPYAVWVRANAEADPYNLDKTVDDLVNTNQITLKERLLLEGSYFKRTHNHLDRRSTTLCAGSRFLNGITPRVHWHPYCRSLGIWDDNSCQGAGLRSRSVSC